MKTENDGISRSPAPSWGAAASRDWGWAPAPWFDYSPWIQTRTETVVWQIALPEKDDRPRLPRPRGKHSEDLKTPARSRAPGAGNGGGTGSAREGS